MNYRDKIKEINKKIKVLKNEKNEYLLSNSKHIFNYFEDKKNISSDPKQEIINNNNKNNNKNIINNFFNISNNKSSNESSGESKDILCKKEKLSDVFTKELNSKEIKTNNYHYNHSDNYIEKYFNNINNTILNIDSFVYPIDICCYCNKGELIHIEEEGILICNNCFVNSPYLFDNERQSYKDPPKEVCFYAYKRINHFKEILSQFQGKETTQIQNDIIENIKCQIKKERLTISQLTNQKTKDILKKLGYNKYYEHITFIKSKLGIKPPIMSQELEETLCNLFTELQIPYSKFCPDNRVNFLNYYYTVYKLCELLDKTVFLEQLPMLKDREKIIEQDSIWKKICAYLDWEFIATI